MPLTFPLPLNVFADTLLVQEVTFDLPEMVEQSRTAGGEQLIADMGERLWTGRVSLGAMVRSEIGRPETLIQVLKQGRTFQIYDRRRMYPLLDPTGSVLGAASVSILALGTDPRELALAGLPVGYTLSAGDYLSFAYTSLGVTRQALHRVVDAAVVANGSGQTALFEVVPPIRPGAVAGLAPPDNATITLSVYVKAAGRTFFWMETRTKAVTFPIAFFDLSTGAVAATFNGATALIADVGGGWYRCTLTANILAGAGQLQFTCGPSLGSTFSSRTYLGDGVSGVFVWGAQFEAGAVATPYQPVELGHGPPEAGLPRNVLRYTEQFDNAVWTKTGSSISANAITAPDGSLTADQIVENTANTVHRISQTPTANPGATVTLKKPFAKAVMVAGSVSPSQGRSTLYEGLGFDWVQTLR